MKEVINQSETVGSLNDAAETEKSDVISTKQPGTGGEEILADITCYIFRMRDPELAAQTLCHFNFDIENDAYLLEMNSCEGLTPDQKEKVEQNIIDFFTILERFADSDTSECNTNGGQIFLDTKMELLEILERYLKGSGFKYLNIMSREHSLLPQTFPKTDYAKQIEKYSNLAHQAIAENPDHVGTLLQNAFVRAYTNYESYLACAQHQSQDLNQDRLNLSTLLMLADEKIRFEERRDPRIPKDFLGPGIFLN